MDFPGDSECREFVAFFDQAVNPKKRSLHKWLVALFIFSAAFLIWSESASAQSATRASDLGDGVMQNYERRCLIKVEKFNGSHDLDDVQILRIRYLLSEQRRMADLFKNHSLLGENRLQEKLNSILEMTQFEIERIFTPEQLSTWRYWDRKIDAKVRSRQRILPAP